MTTEQARAAGRRGQPDGHRRALRRCRGRPDVRGRRAAPGTVVATSPLGGAEDVDRAVDAAQAAFEGDWGSMAASDRGRLLLRFAQVVRDHEDELATLESRQIGKPISGARWEVGQVAQGARVLRGRDDQAPRVDDPGHPPGARPHAARADRRRRADRALELPDHDGQLEGRARARRRQHRDPQARLVLAADGAAPGRARARGGAAGRASSTSSRGPGRSSAARWRPTRGSARSRSPARRRRGRRSCAPRRARSRR